MKLPRDVDAQDFVKHLIRHRDYPLHSQHGSHIILITETPEHHRLPVPNHKAMHTGTFRNIVAEICTVKQIDRDALLRDF